MIQSTWGQNGCQRSERLGLGHVRGGLQMNGSWGEREGGRQVPLLEGCCVSTRIGDTG